MILDLVDHIEIKEWIPELKKPHPCYLYDFKAMGITPYQLGEILWGKEALLFERPFREKIGGVKCPWCDYDSRKMIRGIRREYWRGYRLQDHIQQHKKNILHYQILKFQGDLYSLRLGLVRQGWHECMMFMVQYTCQLCLNPRTEGRIGMCAIPSSTRNRPRCLKVLGYPIEHIKKMRKHDWSVLGIIVLM